jgi:hypothetical protein
MSGKLSLIAQIKTIDVAAPTEELERALSAAPGLLAVEGILGGVSARDHESYYAALKLVMSDDKARESEDAYQTLTALDKLVGPELHGRLLDTETDEFAEQAILYSSPRENAAYALGLAVGLLFAGGVR